MLIFLNWPRGPTYNNDMERTIYLGYLNRNHYTLMHTSPGSEIRDSYEIIKYYVKNFTIDSEVYPIVFDSQNDINRVHGLLNLETYKIININNLKLSSLSNSGYKQIEKQESKKEPSEIKESVN